MNRFRLSGSTVFDTCSAETTVPWMTRRSSSAARMAGASSLGALRGDRGARDDAGGLDLADPLGDELGLDRLEVHLLHAGGGLVVVELGDLVEEGLGVLVAGPQPLEVEDRQAAEPPDLDGRARAHHPVHGRGHERQLEAVGVDLPGDVDVLGIAGPPARDDGDVVEAVGPPTRLVDADLDLSHLAVLPCATHGLVHRRPPAYSTIPSAPPGRRCARHRAGHGWPGRSARTAGARSPGPQTPTEPERSEQLDQDPGGRAPDGLAGQLEEPDRERPVTAGLRTRAGAARHDQRSSWKSAVGGQLARGPRRRRAPTSAGLASSAGRAGRIPTTGVMVGRRRDRRQRREPADHRHRVGVEPDLLGRLAQSAGLGGLPGVEATTGKAHLPGVRPQVGRPAGEHHPGLARLLEQRRRARRPGRRGRGTRRRRRARSPARRSVRGPRRRRAPGPG